MGKAGKCVLSVLSVLYWILTVRCGWFDQIWSADLFFFLVMALWGSRCFGQERLPESPTLWLQYLWQSWKLAVLSVISRISQAQSRTIHWFMIHNLELLWFLSFSIIFCCAVDQRGKKTMSWVLGVGPTRFPVVWAHKGMGGAAAVISQAKQHAHHVWHNFVSWYLMKSYDVLIFDWTCSIFLKYWITQCGITWIFHRNPWCSWTSPCGAGTRSQPSGSRSDHWWHFREFQWIIYNFGGSERDSAAKWHCLPFVPGKFSSMFYLFLL